MNIVNKVFTGSHSISKTYVLSKNVCIKVRQHVKNEHI